MASSRCHIGFLVVITICLVTNVQLVRARATYNNSQIGHNNASDENTDEKSYPFWGPTAENAPLQKGDQQTQSSTSTYSEKSTFKDRVGSVDDTGGKASYNHSSPTEVNNASKEQPTEHRDRNDRFSPQQDMNSTYEKGSANRSSDGHHSFHDNVYTLTEHKKLYMSSGKALHGHSFMIIDGKKTNSQCALECLKYQKCQSFNLDHALKRCQLNDATHIEYPSGVTVDTESNYFSKSSFSVAPRALGHCAEEPCSGNGRCLESRSVQGDVIALCLCDAGWSGASCNVSDGGAQWVQWMEWGPCSVSCHRGWRVRHRNCEDSNTQQTLNSGQCYGASLEYGVCELHSCPRWDTWSDWGECSSDTTCGRGVKVRTRTCSNGGIVGVDRHCLGLSNESTPCQGPSCDGPIRLAGSVNPGEGRVELYDSVNDRWTMICTDQVTDFISDLLCRQMGWPGGHPAKNASRFGSSVGEFWLTYINCSGTEQRVAACHHTPWTSTSGICNSDTASPGAVECNVNGVWSIWTAWSECSVTCENGTRTRTRECNHPPPKHSGRTCQGDNTEYKACTLDMCPVDGKWEDWSLWSECSLTCGSGTRNRSRTCVGPYYNGKPCSGLAIETESCNTQLCPVDGEWQLWASWGECSASCGGGRQERTRECQQPLHGGSSCPGPVYESRTCNSHFCPLDGIWLPWSDWGECSLTCGNGTQWRYRDCEGPFHGGQNCTGLSEEQQLCNTHYCPVDGIFDLWSEWEDCSLSCGGGLRSRERNCTGPFYGGSNCFGNWTEKETCNVQPCPVDGSWKPWIEWGDCSVTCGGGQRTRSRECKTAQFGGVKCTGPRQQSEVCEMQHCPVDGKWEAWSGWDDCTKTCGGGQKLRYRVCIGPFYEGQDCVGPWNDTETCNMHSCPVDGIFTQWTQWSTCSGSCGGGQSWRSRNCTGPFHGGQDCMGDWNENKTCNEQPCPVDGLWDTWSRWTECTVSCGGGQQTRGHSCKGVLHGGEQCEGENNQTQHCNIQPCPVDGEFSDWADWSECSLTCSSGTQWRNRSCVGPFHGGQECEGDFNVTQVCNEHPCPVDGIFSDWSPWGPCQETCGSGLQDRQRNCTPPLHGGAQCSGASTESRVCNEHDCPIDGVFSDWSEWSGCSETCGGGMQWKNRTCVPPEYGGLDCDGPQNMSRECNSQPCPVDGWWGEWSDWTACLVTCGGGHQERHRNCTEPQHGGRPCQGERTELQNCGETSCLIPGDWFPWETWSSCTVTCDGGTRSRNRICNMNSHSDLTAPCEGPDEEEADCHTFACWPLAHTCTELGERGLQEDTMADLDPDGPGLATLEPVVTFCDMTSHDGIGVTVINHDQEERHHVKGYEDPGDYLAVLNYNISFDHAASIVDQSGYCEQYISWECHSAHIHRHTDHKVTTGWMTRWGDIADYFGGATPGSESCGCGMNGTCADVKNLCNCDSNDPIWRKDDGLLTFKDDLPVYAFIAGDTGGLKEDGYSQVGPLLCHGN